MFIGVKHINKYQLFRNLTFYWRNLTTGFCYPEIGQTLEKQVKPASGKIHGSIGVDQNISCEKMGTMKAVSISADVFQNRIIDNAVVK